MTVARKPPKTGASAEMAAQRSGPTASFAAPQAGAAATKSTPGLAAWRPGASPSNLSRTGRHDPTP
jgi:hypothetical protein